MESVFCPTTERSSGIVLSMSVFIISRDFHFAASHVISTLPEGHKCRRLHGHSYRVRIELQGDLDSRGMVVDYADLDWIGRLIADSLDHRHLNDVIDDPPTAELIAMWLWQQINPTVSSGMSRVRVGISESPLTWAWFEDAIS